MGKVQAVNLTSGASPDQFWARDRLTEFYINYFLDRPRTLAESPSSVEAELNSRRTVDLILRENLHCKPGNLPSDLLDKAKKSLGEVTNLKVPPQKECGAGPINLRKFTISALKELIEELKPKQETPWAPTFAEKQLNHEVISLFSASASGDHKLNTLLTMLRKPGITWFACNIATTMHRLGPYAKAAAQGQGTLVEDVFVEIGHRLNACPNAFDGKSIGGFGHGLQGVRTACLGEVGRSVLANVLDAMAEQISKAQLNAQAIGNFGYGLQGINTADLSEAGRSALTNVLGALAEQIKIVQLHAQEIGNFGYGLQGVNTADLSNEGKSALTKVLSALAEQIKIVPLDAQAIGNFGYGLQGLNTADLNEPGTSALTNVLGALAEQIKIVTLHAQAIGNFGYGLQGVNTADLSDEGKSALTKVLSALAEQIKIVPLDAQAIGNFGYGLQGVNTADLSDEGKSALTKVLGALAEKIKIVPLHAQAIGNFGYGLQGINTADLNEAGRLALTNVLGALAAQIKNVQLDANAISGVGFGAWLTIEEQACNVSQIVDLLVGQLRHLSTEQSFVTLGASCTLLKVLYNSRNTYLESCNSIFEQIEAAPFTQHSQLRTTSEFTGWALVQQCYALYDRPMPPWLINAVEDCASAIPVQTSRSEERIADLIRRSYASLDVQTNIFVNGFEMDTALRSQHGSPLNLEVDGPHHNHPLQQLADRIRDNYLRSLGWRIVRIRSSSNDEFVLAAADRSLKGLLGAKQYVA